MAAVPTNAASDSASSSLTCPECGATFTKMTNRNRHIRDKHQQKEKYTCDRCRRAFTRKDKYEHHVKACDTQEKKFKRKRPDITRDEPPMKSLRQACFEDDPREIEGVDIDPCIREICKKNWDAIRSRHDEGIIQNVYNIRWTSQFLPDWDDRLVRIFSEQQSRFKINCSHSLLLRHTDTGELKFVPASQNKKQVFEAPRLINNRKDFLSFLNEIRDTDILEHAMQQRPDTKWTVHSILSTSFELNKLVGFPIGCCSAPLPDLIKHNRGIYSLEKDENHGRKYTDNLCLFRCLALHNGASLHALQKPTKEHFQKWEKSVEDRGAFDGILVSQLNEIEDVFNVNIDVFQYDFDQSPPCLVPHRRSSCTHPTTLQVLLYKDHFCYIKDFDKAAHAYACPNCGKLYKEQRRLRRHEKNCTGDKTRNIYPGGVYRPRPSTLELLEMNGIQVDTSFVFPYRATFDFEVFFDDQALPQPSTSDAKTQYTAKHVPLSVSVCSSVPSFEDPVCFVSDGDPQALVDKMVDYLEKISDQAYRLLQDRFKAIFVELDKREKDVQEVQGNGMTRRGSVDPARRWTDLSVKTLRRQLEDYLQQLPVVGFNSAKYDLNVIKPYLMHRLVATGQKEAKKRTDTMEEEENMEGEEEDTEEQGMEGEDMIGQSVEGEEEDTEERDTEEENDTEEEDKEEEENDTEEEDKEEEENDTEEEDTEGEEEYVRVKDLGEEEGDLEEQFLVDEEEELKGQNMEEEQTEFSQTPHKQKTPFIIKRNNEFMCISTHKLKFLDICNFIAPGFSYVEYLAAFDVQEQKGFFPYEYVTNLQVLNNDKLPPQDAFYSTLKNAGISDEDYSYCQRVWKEQNMKTLKDFLKWYNKKDVAPFLQALRKQTKFYETLKLDMLKDAISVSGLSLRYLFKTLSSDTFFSLIGQKHKDLHSLLREHMVGGPSIVFHRYHEKGVSKIRDKKQVQSLVGYDANALYLWALMQEMPTEHPIRRRKEKDFKKEKVEFYDLLSREWLEWIMHSQKVRLQHKFNGKEHALGKRHIRVDGWDADQKTAYQFHGCFFHGHNCHKTSTHTANPFSKRSISELRKNTQTVTDYLKNTVKVKVIEKWECDWEEEKRKTPEIKTFLDQRCFSYRNPFRGLSTITESDILKAVKEETLFGLIQCDIHVPDDRRSFFSEMPPIFKNMDVTRDDLGDFMCEYAVKHRLLSQPRRTLIGSFFGNNILLSTPLLQWYLKHGLRVTAIQQVVEYRPKRCFQKFGDDVSEARRKGDQDPSKAILADTFKLLGNSAYGKTLTNLTNYHNVKYTDEKGAQKLINNPLFRKVTVLSKDVFEVGSAKSTIKWNLPLQIGFFVYQYAKLRMLEFHYDFLDKFVSREDYQLCQMDTDSLYIALSTPTLEQAVRPDLHREFYENYHHWFPASACDLHRPEFVATKLEGAHWDTDDRTCCRHHQTFDKRTPGLFKVEFQGEGIVALCSKTYFCFGKQGQKSSSKGLSKTTNKLTKDSYLQVLKTGTSGSGVNRGFRPVDGVMYTYKQTKNALSYFYIKRQVQADGISTQPLLL